MDGLHKALKEGGGLMDDGIAVGGLRPIQCSPEHSQTTDTVHATVRCDQLFVKEKGVRRRNVLRHLASARYNSSRSLMLA